MLGSGDGQPKIGHELRDVRIAQHLSLSDVSVKTKLQIAYIQAIENMTPEALPSSGYVLGFVRTYATELGLDGDEAVSRYKNEVTTPTRPAMRERAVFVSKRRVKLPRGLISAATVLVLAACLAGWYGSNTKSESQILREAALSTSGNFETESNTPSDPEILTVKAISPSWVQAKTASGKVIMSRIMVSGEIWRTGRGEGTLLSVRDSGAIEVFRGDINLGALGPKGEPLADFALASLPDVTHAEAAAFPVDTDATVIQTGAGTPIGLPIETGSNLTRNGTSALESAN